MFYLRVFALAMIVSSVCYASDLVREKRLADEITDTIVDGDPVFLSADGHQFLSIFTEAEQLPAKGIVVLLHGRGFHPDWQEVIHPLRVGLAESGWHTLSIQLPVLEKQAKYYDYVPIVTQAIPRIESAIAYAREQIKRTAGRDKVVLLAHSCGAHMAMTWLQEESIESIDAYVGIGMGATDYRQPMKHPFPLEKLHVPALDVYAENDYPAVLKMADERWQLVQQGNFSESRQIVIAEADHYYVDRGDVLTRQIARWLDTLFVDKAN